MPSSKSKRADLSRLIERPFAHRGLHGSGRIENSRSAFEAAIDAGFGIELDVQLSRDGEAMVFHDYALDRLTGEAGAVAERSAAELRRVALSGMDETIPTLAEVLELVGGRRAVLIEVKAPRRNVACLCEGVERALRGYAGEAAVMSFNPEVSRWFAAAAPNVPRGLVVTEEGKRGLKGRVERAFSLRRSRAQFLAYDIRDLPSPFAGAARARGLPVLTWTVRSRIDAEKASAFADQIIHELPQGRG